MVWDIYLDLIKVVYCNTATQYPYSLTEIGLLVTLLDLVEKDYL